MNILKRNGNFSNTFPSVFDDIFTRDLFDFRNSNFSNAGTTLPAVNIKEDNNNFKVEVAAPGMTKDDFKIQLDGNTLTISSEVNHDKTINEEEDYSRREFSYESFQRSFTLPKDVVDSDKINAKYDGGVLHLTIPKKEEAKQKPPRLIQIS
ncbi:MAG: Hsp20/alpha crystallin family protein [Ginsengibacter sp.]